MSGGTYTSLAQQSAGVGCIALDQLYRQMVASLQPQANVPTNMLHDLINASDTLIAKPQITLWRQARFHEIRAAATLLLARTSTVPGPINTARQHYQQAKSLYAQASRDWSAAIDDKLRQCDTVDASGELPFMPTEDDNDDLNEPHNNAEEATSSAGYRGNDVQDEFDDDQEQNIVALNASDAQPEASYPTLVAQCFTETLKRNLHLNYIYGVVRERRSDSQEGPIRRVLSTGESYERVAPSQWRLTDEAWAALGRT